MVMSRCRTAGRGRRHGWLLAAALVAMPARGQERATPTETAPSGAAPAEAARTIDFDTLRRRHVVDLEGIAASDVRVLEEGAVSEVRPGVEEIRLERSQVLTRRLPQEAVRIEPEEGAAGARLGWRLPYEIVGVDAAGEAFELEPLVEIDGGGMRPQSGGGFLGRIFAAVRDARRPGESRPLAQPIVLLVTAEVDDVEPRQITLDRTNRFAQVELRAASPNDRVRVRLVPSFDSEGAEIELAVLRGSLALTVSPARIQGLGLETARVVVQARGLPATGGLAVALSADQGSLETSELALGTTGLASTTIRSVTTGVATLRAEAAGVAPADAQVRFVFPWLFLAAALVGGAVGALVRWARTEQAARRSLWLVLLVRGGLTGLVVACAYSVGINLLGFEPAARAGEALVFVLSALGAWFGLPRRAPAALQDA
jgi:hypothetical protein